MYVGPAIRDHQTVQMGNHILRLGMKLHACTHKQFFIQVSRDTAQFFVVFFAKFEKIQDFSNERSKTQTCGK
jgi:hypothetical protein